MIAKDVLENLASSIIESISNGEKSLKELSDAELNTFLSYEMWKDGMEWPDVEELIDDRNARVPLWSRKRMIEYLETVFGY